MVKVDQEKEIVDVKPNKGVKNINYENYSEFNPDSPFYKAEIFFENIVFHSRWILIILFAGLIAAMAGFCIHFVYLVYDFLAHLFMYEKNDMLLQILTFVDKVLVGGLIIMVVIGGYENSVSRLNIANEQRALSWVGKLASSSLKIKLSTSIISISSVHLLKMFLEIDKYIIVTGGNYSDVASTAGFHHIAWTTGIHMTMVFTALILTWMDRMSGH